jgi:hypothetical protein
MGPLMLPGGWGELAIDSRPAYVWSGARVDSSSGSGLDGSRGSEVVLGEMI